MNKPFTAFQDILAAVSAFDEKAYAETRNFADGAVSRLSPYISRGCISTRFVFESVVAKNPGAAKGKFIQELLWRDYFQRLLQAKPDLYDKPVRPQDWTTSRNGIPIAVLNAASGISAIDQAIESLYENGYMHNHFRMYVAALCCNTAKCGFQIPARWMYYHLLDADIASNYASWQWVAGHLTGKSYIANQENINHYSRSVQHRTFLDTTYEKLAQLPIPEILKEHTSPILETLLPETPMPKLNGKPVLLYTFYNLDPLWHRDDDCHRLLILEPSHFRRFPVSEKVMEFTLKLATNIPNLIIYCGAFSQLKATYPNHLFICKEHPLLVFTDAETEPRDWIVPEVTGFFPSFSKYYQKCLKYL